MNRVFHISDMVEILHHLATDRKSAEDQGHEAVDEANRHLLEGTGKREGKELLGAWLDARRHATAGESTGARIGAGLAVFSFVSTVLAFLSGFGAVYAFLAFNGTEPVNVLLFFLIFIMAQGCASLGSALPLVAGKRLVRRLSPFAEGIRQLLFRTMDKAGSSLNAENRASLKQIIGQLQSGSRTYSETFFMLVFSRVQLIGVSFALGSLLAFAVRILFFDTAFGWQTTLTGEAAPEILHSIVRIIALPWTWATPSGVPTPEAISGSRIIIKEGILALSGAHLASWWPFLALSLFVYGLFPRLLLLVISRRALKVAVNRNLMAAPEVRELLGVLSAPSIATRIEEARVPESEENLTRLKEAPAAEEEVPVPARRTILVPEELLGLENGIEAWVRRRYPDATIREVSLEDEPPALLPSPGIGLLVEAWQPPIRETLDWIFALRESIEAETPLTLLLAGEIGKEAITRPEESHVQIWRKSIGALAKPGIRVDVPDF